jgi:hypothetical protein
VAPPDEQGAAEVWRVASLAPVACRVVGHSWYRPVVTLPERAGRWDEADAASVFPESLQVVESVERLRAEVLARARVRQLRPVELFQREELARAQVVPVQPRLEAAGQGRAARELEVLVRLRRVREQQASWLVEVAKSQAGVRYPGVVRFQAAARFQEEVKYLAAVRFQEGVSCQPAARCHQRNLGVGEARWHLHRPRTCESRAARVRLQAELLRPVFL